MALGSSGGVSHDRSRLVDRNYLKETGDRRTQARGKTVTGFRAGEIKLGRG